jgi:5-methylcytosine-specific restriction endonuclease McrA
MSTQQPLVASEVQPGPKRKRKPPVKTARWAAVLEKRKGSGNPNWHGGKAQLKCMVCSKPFEVIPSRANKAKCCSLSCWNAWQTETRISYPGESRGRKFTRIAINQCGHCGRRFALAHFRRNNIVMCSPECRTARRRAVCIQVHPRAVRVCVRCAKTFHSKQPSRKFCSTKCYNATRRTRVGPLSPGWKGGKSSESKRIRASREYAEWRLAVFTRDKFTCQKCGAKGIELNAHHIKKFADHPELRMFVPNGITLCEPCHESLKYKEHLFATELQGKVTRLL